MCCPEQEDGLACHLFWGPDEDSPRGMKGRRLSAQAGEKRRPHWTMAVPKRRPRGQEPVSAMLRAMHLSPRVFKNFLARSQVILE